MAPPPAIRSAIPHPGFRYLDRLHTVAAVSNNSPTTSSCPSFWHGENPRLRQAESSLPTRSEAPHRRCESLPARRLWAIDVPTSRSDWTKTGPGSLDCQRRLNSARLRQALSRLAELRMTPGACRAWKLHRLFQHRHLSVTTAVGVRSMAPMLGRSASVARLRRIGAYSRKRCPPPGGSGLNGRCIMADHPNSELARRATRPRSGRASPRAARAGCRPCGSA